VLVEVRDKGRIGDQIDRSHQLPRRPMQREAALTSARITTDGRTRSRAPRIGLCGRLDQRSPEAKTEPDKRQQQSPDECENQEPEPLHSGCSSLNRRDEVTIATV